MMGAVLPFVPPPLAPRDPRFVPRPVEMCQLAGVWKSAPLPAGWDAEEKVDGIRCLWADRALWSREGNPLDVPHVAAELARLERRFGEPMAFDGEYQEPGGFLDTLAWASSRGKREATGTFHLFDALPLDDWRRDACQEPLTDRRRAIGWAMGDWEPQHVRRFLPRPVANAGDVDWLAAEVWARGGEGLVLKDGASLYRRTRSAAWLKHKRELQLTGTVTEILGEASVRVAIAGRVVKVAVPPPLRGTPIVGNACNVKAMEWTASGMLRQGRLEGIGKD